MHKSLKLETSRLKLRQWHKDDWPLFADLNADPEVMAFYPSTLTAQQSNNLADKLSSLISQNGWGFWAVEIMAQQQFIGFVGLHKPTYALPVEPCVEIGWRLAKTYWGNGYATEAALSALRFAFDDLDLNDVYAFTSISNHRSESVMQRIGMINTQQNFKHPMIPKGHRLEKHMLYRIRHPAL